jgi:hypothetical protein
MSAIDDSLSLSLSHRVQSARASKEEDKEEEKGGKNFGEKKESSLSAARKTTNTNDDRFLSLSLSFSLLPAVD